MEIDINYTFSFGKFKGKTVKNILIGPTRSYLEWVITNFDDIIFPPAAARIPSRGHHKI